MIKSRMYFGVLFLLLCTLQIGPFQVAQAESNDLHIELIFPSDGESFYAGPTSMLYSIPIRGWVDSSSFPPQEIDVEARIFQNEQLLVTKRVRPDQTGFFQIEATVNPDAEIEDFPLDHSDCGPECHYPTDFELPAGKAILEILAIDPDGNQASIRRNIAIDRSGYAIVPVQIVLENNVGESLNNIPIHASTRLYMWRTRYATGSTDKTGYVDLKVEALSLASTHYMFRVEPIIVDGVLYESIAPVNVSLPPGATSASPIELKVRARRGQVDGTFVSSGDMPAFQPEIWAIHLPDGTTQTVATNPQGSFSINNLPIGQYLFTADSESLISQGYVVENKTIDLTTSLDETLLLRLALLSGQTWRGIVREEGGGSLPFAWINLEKTGASTRIQPDGNFVFYDLKPEASAVVVGAPGYYSQARHVDFAKEPESLDFDLRRRPDTLSLPWGNGEVVIPSETVSIVDGDEIKLKLGWIWGNSGIPQPLVIWVSDVMISPASGRFALEHDPINKQTWLYVFDGDVIIHQHGYPITKIQSGQMAAIIKDEQPVPVLMNSVVFSSLHANRIIPISPTWEPTLNAQIRDRMALIGIGTAQTITFITYGIILITIAVFPLVALYLRVIRRNQRMNEEYHET